MAKRGVINPVYGCTNAAFFGKHRSMLRKLWMYSQMYKDAINRAKVPYLGGGQRKYSIKVECCGTEYKIGERIAIGETKSGKEKRQPRRRNGQKSIGPFKLQTRKELLLQQI